MLLDGISVARDLLRYDNLESGSQLCLASGAASRPRGTVHVGTTLRYLGAERPSFRMRRNGALTPDSARQKAKQALGELAAGRDPWGSPRQKAELGVTFGGQVPRFLERQRSALKRRSMIEVTHHLMVHAAPLNAKPLDKIGRRDIAALLADVEAPTAADTHEIMFATAFRHSGPGPSPKAWPRPTLWPER
jgi:hypothetical protein